MVSRICNSRSLFSWLDVDLDCQIFDLGAWASSFRVRLDDTSRATLEKISDGQLFLAGAIVSCPLRLAALPLWN